MFKLMLVTDRRRSTRPITETVRMALAGGVDAVQLRERDLSARELYDLALKLRATTREAGAALIVNQRLDVALAVGADGVHLGWRSLSPADVRKLAGKKLPDRHLLSQRAADSFGRERPARTTRCSGRCSTPRRRKGWCRRSGSAL